MWIPIWDRMTERGEGCSLKVLEGGPGKAGKRKGGERGRYGERNEGRREREMAEEKKTRG